MLEEGQQEWGKERVMGEQEGGETRQNEKGKRHGGGGRNQGKCVRIVQESQMESKCKACRNSTEGKGTSRIWYVALLVL